MAEDAAAELLAKAGPDFLCYARLMRLLVTRPETDALKLRAALEEHGPPRDGRAAAAGEFEEIDTIDFDGVQALIATSRNACAR